MNRQRQNRWIAAACGVLLIPAAAAGQALPAPVAPCRRRPRWRAPLPPPLPPMPMLGALPTREMMRALDAVAMAGALLDRDLGDLTQRAQTGSAPRRAAARRGPQAARCRLASAPRRSVSARAGTPRAGAVDARRRRFSAIIDAKAARTDAALYWKAYALDKLNQQADALATVAELLKGFPNSRWIGDAKALEIQVRQRVGQPVRPEAESDEDLKLLAIQGLQQSDPEQAVPMLEKFLQGNQSPRLKQRALFVLAQSNSPKAREVLTGIARGGSNPDLQSKAIQYLGINGTRENRQVLADIYASSTDVQVKRQILQGMFVGGDSARLIDIANTEPNLDLRRTAIRQLGTMSRANTGDALVAIYGKEKDQDLKRQAVNGLFIQNNAEALVALARKESDPIMKKDIVSKLSLMKSKVALDYLMEILNK